MKLEQITAPAFEPITTADARAFLRLDDTAEDSVIAELIKVARHRCEGFTGRALVTQTWSLWLDEFPRDKSRRAQAWDGMAEGAIGDLLATRRFIEIPKAPLQSISWLKTYADDDTAATFAAASYFVDTKGEPPRLVLRSGYGWPAATRLANAIEIRFTAGYADDGSGGSPTTETSATANVPPDIKEGIRRFVAHAYANRGDDGLEAVQASGAAKFWRPYKWQFV